MWELFNDLPELVFLTTGSGLRNRVLPGAG